MIMIFYNLKYIDLIKIKDKYTPCLFAGQIEFFNPE